MKEGKDQDPSNIGLVGYAKLLCTAVFVRTTLPARLLTSVLEAGLKTVARKQEILTDQVSRLA